MQAPQKVLEALKVLNCTPRSNFNTVKKAYKVQAVKFHPDKSPDPNAGEVFKQLSGAFDLVDKYVKEGGNLRELEQFRAPAPQPQAPRPQPQPQTKRQRGRGVNKVRVQMPPVPEPHIFYPYMPSPQVMYEQMRQHAFEQMLEAEKVKFSHQHAIPVQTPTGLYSNQIYIEVEIDLNTARAIFNRVAAELNAPQTTQGPQGGLIISPQVPAPQNLPRTLLGPPQLPNSLLNGLQAPQALPGPPANNHRLGTFKSHNYGLTF